jgi:GR25 family glycosyltransferase involved in LPS biosynthesis
MRPRHRLAGRPTARPLALPPSADVAQLHDLFDVVLVINLARRPDRWQRACQILAEHGSLGPRRIEAVDGQQLPAGKLWSGGAVGCLRSHALCHEIVLTEQPHSALVLEDDFAAPDDLGRRLGALRAAAPEWDLLVLGQLWGWGAFAYATTPRASRIMLPLLQQESRPADEILLYEMPALVRARSCDLFGHARVGASDIS